MAGRREHPSPVATTRSTAFTSHPNDPVMSYGNDRRPSRFPKDLGPSPEARVLARMEEGRTTAARTMYSMCTLYEVPTRTTRASSEYGCGGGRRDPLTRPHRAPSNVLW